MKNQRPAMITKLRSDVGPIVVKRDEIVKRGQIGLGWVKRGEPNDGAGCGRLSGCLSAGLGPRWCERGQTRRGASADFSDPPGEDECLDGQVIMLSIEYLTAALERIG
jgi:hypothetical protein